MQGGLGLGLGAKALNPNSGLGFRGLGFRAGLGLRVMGRRYSRCVSCCPVQGLGD